jgi:hypothetical protein
MGRRAEDAKRDEWVQRFRRRETSGLTVAGNAALKTRSSTGLNARSREGDRLLPPLRFLRKIQLY